MGTETHNAGDTGTDRAESTSSEGNTPHQGCGGDRDRSPGPETRALLTHDRRASLPIRHRGNRLTTAIRAACFWVAIALPFLYVPLLIAGVETRAEGLALVALLALNALSLLVGHPHRSG